MPLRGSLNPAMTETTKPGASRLRKEAILFGLLFLCGLLLLPIAIYLVGNNVFGGYGDGGLREFLAALAGRALTADPAALLLVLSPYLVVQGLRLSFAALRWRRPAT